MTWGLVVAVSAQVSNVIEMNTSDTGGAIVAAIGVLCAIVVVCTLLILKEIKKLRK